MKKSSSRIWIGTFAAAMLATGLMAWRAGSEPYAPGTLPEEFLARSSGTAVLGAALPLTGRLADAARYYGDAYRFAVDQINEKGGLTVGGKKHKLALRLLDNKSDPKLNERLQERLVARDKVDFLLGPYSGNDVLAAAAIAEKYGVPLVQAGGASGRIFSGGNKYVFGTLPPAEDYFRSTIEMIARLKPQARTVALVSGDDSFNAALSNGTGALVKKAGLQTVLDQQYSEGSPNFYNILTLIESKAPDVLLWSGHEAGAIKFIREAKARRINPKLLASFTIGVSTPKFQSALGKDANYLFGMTPWFPSERLKDRWFGDASQFAAAYERKFRYPPDYHAAAAAAAVETLAGAIETAGTLDRGKVRDAVAAASFDSLYGRIEFGETGHIALPQIVIQIQNDKVVEIFSDRFINEPLYPVPIWDNRS